MRGGVWHTVRRASCLNRPWRLVEIHDQRQHQQRRTAQRVVGPEQQPAVDPVGQPAGRDRTRDVEEADQGEQPGRGRFRHAVVVCGRDEMRTDQAVGGRSADREAAGEQPERPGPGGRAQGAQRPPRRAPT